MGDIVLSGGTSSGGGGGAATSVSINDGVDTSIKATVFDRTNSNPIAVELVDTNGDPISVGGGTQYAEDTPSTAGELVTMAGVVRKDTRGTLVDTDGDRTELQTNAFGDLRVDGSAVSQPVLGGYFESVANSTTTPLLLGTTFTGTYESTLNYGGVRVSVFSDTLGTLFVDWSSDGVNLDIEDSYPVSPSVGVFVQPPIKAKFVRIKYTQNNVNNGTALRLQTAYMTFQTPDIFDALMAPIGTSGALAPWNTHALVTGGENLNGTGVSNQKFITFAWSDEAVTDGGYNVQMVRALAGEGDGALIRLFAEAGGNPTGYFAGGGVVRDVAPVALADTRGGAVRITPYRAFHTNLRDAVGNELLGQKVMASSVPVVIASNQTPITVTGSLALGGPTTSVTTRINPSLRQSVVLLAANASRKEGMITNLTDAPFFLMEGSGASDVNFVAVIPPRARYTFDDTVEIDGYWAINPTTGWVMTTERT